MHRRRPGADLPPAEPAVSSTMVKSGNRPPKTYMQFDIACLIAYTETAGSPGDTKVQACRIQTLGSR
jgi:hypothetical protein